MSQKSSTFIGGSIKNKIVNPDLLDERKNLDFDQTELMNFIHGEGLLKYYEPINEDRDKYPEMMNHHSWYEMSPEE